MKKTKMLALTLVVAIMLAGAGYAIWTDTTVLNTGIKTGNFDMEVTYSDQRTGDNRYSNEKNDWHEFDWTHEDSVSVGENKARVRLSGMYPGGMVRTSLGNKNMGTIPAKLADIEVKFIDGNPDLFNLLEAKSGWHADINGDNVRDKLYRAKNFISLNDDMSALVKSLDNIVIEPKGDLNFYPIEFKLDKTANNTFQNEYCEFEIEFKWEQWSDDPTTRPYDDGKIDGYGGDGDLQ